MTKLSSTVFSVGTLLRHAEDTGAAVRMLVQGNWLEGRVIGCDGIGAVLDDGNGEQVLVRLEVIAAVKFSRAQMEGEDLVDFGARSHNGGERGPIEAGTVTVPTQKGAQVDLLATAPY